MMLRKSFVINGKRLTLKINHSYIQALGVIANMRKKTLKKMLKEIVSENVDITKRYKGKDIEIAILNLIRLELEKHSKMHSE
ncbi:MAG: hypothetical protein AB1488_06705 [Nitrospirota bacterium]